MTSAEQRPSTVPGVDPTLVSMLGRARARKLRRFVEQTGHSQEFLLKFGIDLVGCALAHLPSKNAEAVEMAKARWGKLTPKERTEIARNAVSARWAKYRREMTEEVGLSSQERASEGKD